MNQPATLTIEQQFSLRKFEEDVKKMSREEAQSRLVKAYENLMILDNKYKKMLRTGWGLGDT